MSGYYIAFGAQEFPPRGMYYEGDHMHWKDMAVPRRPEATYTWSPNPDRPTYDDWQFDGHDADGGYWVAPAEGSE
ncbi:hypothetical protein [Herbaspirillum sp. C7C8]|uniref:hypothetical protein n=1 Tax=Herbaspirillum sp. C7C8 TaxID=2736665 RepID=UPI001F526978|nr:hypothetical protein [Herbaspirillum sp. C7C8]MCI1005200.1 hypothetical protein [Herbaspirillum sp. C7C8]